MSNPEIRTASPTPTQMFDIAAIAMCLSGEQGEIKHSRYTDNARSFTPRSVHESEMSADCKVVSQKFLGLVARQGYGRDRSWTMKLRERVWVVQNESSDSLRITHSFAWNTQNVTQAQRAIQLQLETDDDIYDDEYIGDMDLLLSPGLHNAAREMGIVTFEECRALAQQLKQFSQTSHEKLHYNR